MEYMHHTYISSAVLSLRTKGSLSFSFHDCSNLFNERFEENPLFSSPAQFCSSCCCCCSCCSAPSSFATHRLHISPSSLYGLRQSNLIQWSPCKRLIFGGRGKYYFRVPAYGPDHRGYDVSYSYRESSGRKRIEKCRRGKFGDINLRESQCLSGVNDVEALLSLLSEEVSEEYIGDRGRKECLSERVEIKERENYAGDFQEGKKKNVRSGLLGSSSKCEFESVGVDSRNEESRRMEQGQKCEEIEEAAAVSNGENHRERRASSSFSSYYSLSSMEDFESDNEARDKHGEVVEESSSGSRRKLLVGEARPEGQVIEEFQRHREDAEGQGEILGQRTTATSTGFEWEMRKKSEKKLTEVEEMQSRKQSSPKHLRIAGTDERDYNKGSNYVKKIDNEEERATLEVNLEKGRRKKSSQRDNQVQEQSKFRRNYQEASNIQEICGINVETTSKSQKQFSDREENVMVDANLIRERRGHHRKIYDESSRKENLGRNTQQLVELSEFGNFDMEGVSNFQRHSESGMKIHEEDGKRTSILQLETRSKKQDGSKSIVSNSGAGTTEQQFSSDHNALQRIQSRRGSQDVSNISVNVANVSVLHATDIKTITDSQSTFENRIIDQGSTLTSVVKPFQGTRQTDESLTQFKSGNEASRVAKVSKSHERTSHQASSSQASLNWESQERKRLMEEDDQRNLQPIMLPPSAQIVDRGSLLVDQTMEIPGEEVSMETSESGSSAFYTTSGGRTPAHLNETYGRDRKGETFNEPLNLPASQDALGSAHRLAESSTCVVGEFVEKAKHEVLTSNIQEEETVIVSGLVYEGEKHGGKSSGQFASDRTQLKDQDSLQLSEGSGVKGPSDEIWDVMDPSVEPPEKEAPESSTATENLVVRRTGRSLWSIIANIARLRWGSHAETPKSTGKSGRKSSSNESVSSEAYFSGHDPDETIDKNGKRERRRMPREETSYPQVQLIQTTSLGQEEASDIVAAKGRRVLQSDTPSPSIRPKSGSTSKGISSPEGDEYHGFSRDGKGFEVFSSSMEGKESLLVPLHSGGMSSPIRKESSGVGETNVSGKGLNEPPEQPVMGKLPGVSDTEGKDWELKRRMLQRNKQVPKDRFDEWEEAYIRDSEQRKIDEMFMREALLEAKKAADTWEVPVGAVLVQHGKIIARGYNLVEELRDSTAHAEMICIREASNQLRSWRLSDTTLYVTLEPCPMCAGAILQARIDALVWGAPNKLLGADGSWIRLFPNGGEGRNGSELTDKPAPPVHPFHPKMRIQRGILESECAEAMQQFFQLRRRKRDKNEDPSLEPSRLPIANRPSKVLNKLHDIFHAMFCL